jgi:hypothetical protein
MGDADARRAGRDQGRHRKEGRPAPGPSGHVGGGQCTRLSPDRSAALHRVQRAHHRMGLGGGPGFTAIRVGGGGGGGVHRPVVGILVPLPFRGGRLPARAVLGDDAVHACALFSGTAPPVALLRGGRRRLRDGRQVPGGHPGPHRPPGGCSDVAGPSGARSGHPPRRALGGGGCYLPAQHARDGDPTVRKLGGAGSNRPVLRDRPLGLHGLGSEATPLAGAALFFLVVFFSVHGRRCSPAPSSARSSGSEATIAWARCWSSSRSRFCWSSASSIA